MLCVACCQDKIHQGLTSPPTQYRSSARQFYRSKDPANSIKVLKENSWPATRRDPIPPGASHCVTSEPLKRNYHSGWSPARWSPTQQTGLSKSCIDCATVDATQHLSHIGLGIHQANIIDDMWLRCGLWGWCMLPSGCILDAGRYSATVLGN